MGWRSEIQIWVFCHIQVAEASSEMTSGNVGSGEPVGDRSNLEEILKRSLDRESESQK